MSEHAAQQLEIAAGIEQAGIWDTMRQRAANVGVAAVACGSILLATACGTSEQSDEAVPYYVDRDGATYSTLMDAAADTPEADVRQQIESIAETPIATWLTDPNIENTKATVERIVTAAETEGAMPVFALYNLPDRDLGGESAGGIVSAEQYQEWIGVISGAIADRPAMVILEPDALPAALQQEGQQREERLTMLRNALAALQAANSNAHIYVDGGHSDWLSPTQVADLLVQVDPEGRFGVALNVSNQRTNEETEAYAVAIRLAAGRPEMPVVWDTSMNGNDNPPDEFCNPSGEQLGAVNDDVFDPRALDEQVFVKEPGFSDGSCGTSSVRAGGFDAGLLRRQIGR